jgi:hypothetical protein
MRSRKLLAPITDRLPEILAVSPPRPLTSDFRSSVPSKLNSELVLVDFLRKEVIQPQVPLRLPCYDFTPITDHTLGRCLPERLAHALLVQPTFVV